MYTCVVHVARVNKCLLCALVCACACYRHICLSAVEGSDPRLSGIVHGRALQCSAPKTVRCIISCTGRDSSEPELYGLGNLLSPQGG